MSDHSEFDPTTLGIVGIIIALILLATGALGIFLTFVVYGISQRMDKLIQIQKTQLSHNERLVAEVASLRNGASASTNSQPSILTSPFRGAFAEDENILG